MEEDQDPEQQRPPEAFRKSFLFSGLAASERREIAMHGDQAQQVALASARVLYPSLTHLLDQCRTDDSVQCFFRCCPSLAKTMAHQEPSMDTLIQELRLKFSGSEEVAASTMTLFVDHNLVQQHGMTLNYIAIPRTAIMDRLFVIMLPRRVSRYNLVFEFRIVPDQLSTRETEIHANSSRHDIERHPYILVTAEMWKDRRHCLAMELVGNLYNLQVQPTWFAVVTDTWTRDLFERSMDPTR